MPTAESPQEVLKPDPKKEPNGIGGTGEPALNEVKPEGNGFLNREQWLAQAGRFAEKTIDVPGLGKVLIAELSGLARAQIQAQQSAGLLADSKRVDVAAYQRAVLLAGVIDPTSPPDARRPLFQGGDMDRVMSLGGGKITIVVTEIEKLSGLDESALSRAEENSGEAPSGAGTS